MSNKTAENKIKSFLAHKGTDDSKTLKHYGVKGMKWGVRKDRRVAKISTGTTGSIKKQKITSLKDRPRPTSRSNADRENTKTNPKKLTDTQLRSAINRLEMEKRYRNLSTPGIEAGKKFVTGVLVDSGKAVATAYAKHYMFQKAEKITKVKLTGEQKKGDKKSDKKTEDEEKKK